jgi:hypothetical protein
MEPKKWHPEEGKKNIIFEELSVLLEGFPLKFYYLQ